MKVNTGKNGGDGSSSDSEDSAGKEVSTEAVVDTHAPGGGPDPETGAGEEAEVEEVGVVLEPAFDFGAYARARFADNVYAGTMEGYHLDPKAEDVPCVLRAFVTTGGGDSGQCLNTLDYGVRRLCCGFGLFQVVLLTVALYDFGTDVVMMLQLVRAAAENNTFGAEILAGISATALSLTVLVNLVTIVRFMARAAIESELAMETLQHRPCAVFIAVVASLTNVELMATLVDHKDAANSVAFLHSNSALSVVIHTIPHLFIQLFLAASTSSFDEILILSAIGTVGDIVLQIAGALANYSVSDRLNAEDTQAAAASADMLPSWSMARGKCGTTGWLSFVSHVWYLAGGIFGLSISLDLVLSSIRGDGADGLGDATLALSHDQREFTAGCIALTALCFLFLTRLMLATGILSRGRSIPHRGAIEVAKHRKFAGITLVCATLARPDCILGLGVLSERAVSEITAAGAAWDLFLLPFAFIPLGFHGYLSNDTIVLATAVILAVIFLASGFRYVRHGLVAEVYSAREERIGDERISVECGAVLRRAFLTSEANLELAVRLDPTEGSGRDNSIEDSTCCDWSSKKEAISFSRRALCGLCMLLHPVGHSELERFRWQMRAMYSTCHNLVARTCGSLFMLLAAALFGIALESSYRSQTHGLALYGTYCIEPEVEFSGNFSGFSENCTLSDACSTLEELITSLPRPFSARTIFDNSSFPTLTDDNNLDWPEAFAQVRSTAVQVYSASVILATTAVLVIFGVCFASGLGLCSSGAPDEEAPAPTPRNAASPASPRPRRIDQRGACWAIRPEIDDEIVRGDKCLNPVVILSSALLGLAAYSAQWYADNMYVAADTAHRDGCSTLPDINGPVLLVAIGLVGGLIIPTLWVLCARVDLEVPTTWIMRVCSAPLLIVAVVFIILSALSFAETGSRPTIDAILLLTLASFSLCVGCGGCFADIDPSQKCEFFLRALFVILSAATAYCFTPVSMTYLPTPGFVLAIAAIPVPLFISCVFWRWASSEARQSLSTRTYRPNRLPSLRGFSTNTL